MEDLTLLIKNEVENNRLELLKNEEKYAELKLRLSKAISKMIDTDFNGLLNALYRVDVNESKLKIAIAQCAPGDVPDIIAEMVIQRIIQKMEFRRKYSEGRD